MLINYIDTYEPLLQSIHKRKLKWNGHKIRYNNFRKKTHQGMCEGLPMVEGNRKRVDPKYN